MTGLAATILAVMISGFVRDSGSGNGIAGVVVSDGFSCTVTAGDGSYSLRADSLARTVGISVPDAYEIPLGRDGRPLFYHLIPSASYDFPLTPRKRGSRRFSLVALADIHVVKPADMKRFDRESVPDIQKTIDGLRKDGPVIGVALGDQVTDTPSYTAPVQKRLASFRTGRERVPFFLCIGNHDHFNADGRSELAVTERFVRESAPRDYSFNMGGVHFVVLDNVQYKGSQKDITKIAYTDGLTDSQIEWLRQDLSYVADKDSRAVVLCMHSPLFGRFANKNGLKALLGGFREVHILSGHSHNINNVWHSDTIWEHNVQSLCGSWWYSNVSPNGSPNGYAVLSFEDGVLSEEYNKATGEGADLQMRVYDGNDSYDEHTPYSGLKGPSKMPRTYGWPEELKGCFVVRVWDGTRGWDVKFVQGGKEVPMKQTEFKFPDACTYAYMVNVHGAPCGGRGIYRDKLDAFWIFEAPCGDPALEKDWEIVATHHMPSGRNVEYRTSVLTRDYRGFRTGSHYKRRTK